MTFVDAQPRLVAVPPEPGAPHGAPRRVADRLPEAGGAKDGEKGVRIDSGLCPRAAEGGVAAPARKAGKTAG